ncbi:MAG: SDR family NAD(P)-dependent oxidoreductase [Acidobacteriota bacterium]|nr:SDR family NAD(P)-dependent oxidoreductase [Acidobacteriota bacterium]
MSFQGKNVIVTGGTGALGRAVCEVFLKGGARVHTSYIVAGELDNLPDVMRDNPDCTYTKVELTDESAVKQWFQAFGAPDILVNVAGGFAMSSIADTDYEGWKHMFTMNLDTCFIASREALRRMDKHKQGRIINVAAYAAARALPGMGPYTASKNAVMHLTQVMAEETLQDDITVNAVMPTIMDTPANRSAMPQENFSAWVPVENVAATVAFLAQDESWHITGACIPTRGKC